MKQQDIIDIYKEIGIGTQTERDQFLKWDCGKDYNNTYFFIEAMPNSKEID